MQKLESSMDCRMRFLHFLITASNIESVFVTDFPSVRLYEMVSVRDIRIDVCDVMVFAQNIIWLCEMVSW
jgi:hypothetical protein